MSNHDEWQIPTPKRVTKLDAERGFARGRKIAKNLLHLKSFSLEEDHNVVFELQNGLQISIDYRKIREMKEMNGESIRSAEILGDGSIIFLPEREEMLNVDCIIKNILAESLSKEFVSWFTSSEFGRRTSIRKAKASAENGKKGGRPKKISTVRLPA